jgi:pimeloyl-ACP methyl ester carboxylesterase
MHLRALQRAALTLLALMACAACERAPQSIDDSRASQTPAPHSTHSVDGSPRMASSTDGVHVQYRVYGNAPTAVVLIHGWSCDSTYWNAQLDALRAAYTVVTLDLAGHGASGANRTDWSTANFGADVAAVARELPQQRIVLVGHSMGGPVALEAARLIGPRVIGIIGVETFKSIGLPPLTDAQLERELEPFRRDFIGHMRRFVTDTLFTANADPTLVSGVARDMSQAPPGPAIAAVAALNQMDFDSVLRELRAPIIAINSDMGEPADTARIRSVVPSFRLVTLEGTGHFLMMEAPERFNPLLLQEVALLQGGVDAS